MKAPAADQQGLLQVQAHDTALHQLAHKRANLPELETLAKTAAKHRGIDEDLQLGRSDAAAIQRELTRLEDEISKVEARRRRDQERLESGGGTSRELVSLQQELEALGRRRDVLEEEAIEVMERLESAQQDLAALEGQLAELAAKIEDLRGVLGANQAEIDQTASAEQAARDAAAAGLDADLMKLYERLRERGGGVGAAALIQGRCEGCGFTLSASDLAALRKLAPEEVARCEECGRILVRGEGSGL